MFIINKWIKKLSQLLIDTHKDWGGYRIENLGAPTANTHALTSGSDKARLSVVDATVADFQANAATGTCTDPQYINDNSTTTGEPRGTVDQYAEIDFGKLVAITQWRQYGSDNNNGDGEFKLEILDIYGNWHDWVTGISTRPTLDWSAWDNSGGEIICTKLRWTVTINDSQYGITRLKELQVKY